MFCFISNMGNFNMQPGFSLLFKNNQDFNPQGLLTHRGDDHRLFRSEQWHFFLLSSVYGIFALIGTLEVM